MMSYITTLGKPAFATFFSFSDSFAFVNLPVCMYVCVFMYVCMYVCVYVCIWDGFYSTNTYL
jgi:hypothetical protein